MQNKLGAKFKFMVAVAAIYIVIGPFFWAYNIRTDLVRSFQSKVGYLEMVSFYVPELAVGAVFLVCLPLMFLKPRLAVIGLLFAALLDPVLQFTFGSPANVWLVTVLILALLSWRLHALTAKSGEPARG